MSTEAAAATAPPGSRRRRGGLKRILRWAVTLVFLGLLARLVDVRATAHLLLSVHLPLLAAAVGVAFADRILMILKWYPLLHAQDPSISLGRAARAYFASIFALVIVQAPMSGDVLRAVALGRKKNAVVEIGASIMVERLLGMVGSLILCFVALGIAMETSVRLEYLAPWILGAFGATLALLVLPLNRYVTGWFHRWFSGSWGGRWLSLFQRFAAAFALYRTRVALLVGIGVLSALEQGFPILTSWVVSRALATSVELKMLVVAIPLTLFVERMPITVGQFAVTQGALVYLLGLFGVPPHESLAIGLGGSFLNIMMAVPGAFFWSDIMGAGERERAG